MSDSIYDLLNIFRLKYPYAYIHPEFNVKVEIPKLELFGDGSGCIRAIVGSVFNTSLFEFSTIEELMAHLEDRNPNIMY